MGMFRRQRAATHFANSDKVGKTPFKGEMFRFISPLKIPLFTDQSRPRKLQITRLARKGKTRSFRYSSSPNGNRLCWISIGLPFRHPHWMYPLGTRTKDGGRGAGRKTQSCRAGAFFMAPDGPYPFCPFGTFPPDRGNRPRQAQGQGAPSRRAPRERSLLPVLSCA